jgi:TonB family protein
MDTSSSGPSARSLSAAVALGALCLVGPVPATAQDPIPEAPTVTPFTVAPQILNRDEVVEAMRSAYPTRLRDAGIGGTVSVWFYIDDQGRVARRIVNEGSGVEELDRAALELAGVYRFSPAMNRERRVGVWVSLPITFATRSDPRTE